VKIKTKFSLFAGLLVSLVVLSTSILFLVIEKQHLIAEKRQNQIYSIERLRRVCSESLLREDDLFLINYMKTMKTVNKTILYVMFMDERGRVVAHDDLKYLGALLSDRITTNAVHSNELLFQKYAEGSEKIVDMALPVFLGNFRKGSVRIGFSRKALEDEIAQVMSSTRKSILYVALASLLIGLAGSILLSHAMTRPIRSLAKAAELIGQGKLDTRIDMKSSDELGLLAAEFNNMALKLKELDEMKRDFVSSVTHELRSPLTAIESYATDLIDGGEEQLKKTGIDDLAVIKNNSIRLSRFINDLLDTAKLESGRMDINCKSIDLAATINDAAKLFKAKAGEKEITIKTDIQTGIPNVSADEDRIRQVIINLIGNSIKFTPKQGEIKLSAGTTKDSDSFVYVCVSDNGPGIPADKLDSIFNKFEQIKGTREQLNAPKGTGLGLYIVKNIIELHKGRVWAESPAEPGKKGARFTFILPVTPHG
jgi:signal transduction histidine kinase